MRDNIYFDHRWDSSFLMVDSIGRNGHGSLSFSVDPDGALNIGDDGGYNTYIPADDVDRFLACIATLRSGG